MFTIVAVCIGCPAISSVPEVPPDKVCEGNLRRLGMAVTKYHDQKGRLPQKLKTPEGFEHSWRALIAPYIVDNIISDHEYDYHFNEPWDSLHNRQQLLGWSLFRFNCLLEPNRDDYPFTSYVMLVRPDSGNSNKDYSSSNSLAGEAVFIVESTNCGIEYGEPRDLEWEALWEGDSPFGKGKLNSLHPDVVKALRVDGQVIDIPKNISRERLRRLLQGSLTKWDKIILRMRNLIFPFLSFLCILFIGYLFFISMRRKILMPHT